MLDSRTDSTKFKSQALSLLSTLQVEQTHGTLEAIEFRKRISMMRRVNLDNRDRADMNEFYANAF